METIKVKSIQRHLYEGRHREIGEIYDAEERFVKLLVTIGYVEPVKPVKSDGRYQRRDMRAKQ